MVSRGPRFRLVVLCTGNTCRSPMAAAAFREELGADLERVEIVSAGTAAVDGQPASAGAAAAGARDGLDLSGHRARRAGAGLLRGADLVLVMEQGAPARRDGAGRGPGAHARAVRVAAAR